MESRRFVDAKHILTYQGQCFAQTIEKLGDDRTRGRELAGDQFFEDRRASQLLDLPLGEVLGSCQNDVEVLVERVQRPLSYPAGTWKGVAEIFEKLRGLKGGLRGGDGSKQ